MSFRPRGVVVAATLVLACTQGTRTRIALPIRALGTEPFWAFDIDSASLRFTTPDNQEGIHFPPVAQTVDADTMVWAGATERAAFVVRIWREQCSDGMSDRVYPYAARVRVDTTTYRGCADARARISPGEGRSNR